MIVFKGQKRCRGPLSGGWGLAIKARSLCPAGALVHCKPGNPGDLAAIVEEATPLGLPAGCAPMQDSGPERGRW